MSQAVHSGLPLDGEGAAPLARREEAIPAGHFLFPPFERREGCGTRVATSPLDNFPSLLYN